MSKDSGVFVGVRIVNRGEQPGSELGSIEIHTIEEIKTLLPAIIEGWVASATDKVLDLHMYLLLKNGTITPLISKTPIKSARDLQLVLLNTFPHEK